MNRYPTTPERETLNERVDDDSEAKEDAKWDKVDADYSERGLENEIYERLMEDEK